MGVAPFLLAALIGGLDAAAGLGLRTPTGAGTGICLLTSIVTAVAAASLAANVNAANGQGVSWGVLAIAATYGATIPGHHAGALSAAAAGLALLLLAHVCHTEILLVRRLPSRQLAWGWRVILVMAATTGLLDLAVVLVAGGGRPRPGSPSTLSVAAGCAAVAAVVALATALADGALRARPTRPDPAADSPL